MGKTLDLPVRPACSRVCCRPGLVGIGGRINSEDHVNHALGLDKRVERNVLVVLATIDESELPALGVGVGVVVVVVEGIGVVRDVVLILAQLFEDRQQSGLQSVLERTTAVGVVEQKQALVKERTAGAHDETGAVESSDTFVVVDGRAGGEVGTQILERSEAVDCGIVRAHLPRVEFVDSRVGRDQNLARSSAVSDNERQGSISFCEPILLSDAGEGIFRPAVAGVDQLIRQRTSPVVGEGCVVTGVFLVRDRISDVRIVTYAIENLERALVRPFKDGVLELPKRRISIRILSVIHDVGNR